MTTVTIIAILMLTAFTVAVCIANKQIPASLSQSIYNLPVWGRILWTVVIGTVAVIMAPPFIAHTSENTHFLAYLSCVALALVGATPLVKNIQDLDVDTHHYSAYAAGILSQLAVALNEPELLLMWAPFAIAFIIPTSGTSRWHTIAFWAEITCFIICFTFCLI